MSKIFLHLRKVFYCILVTHSKKFPVCSNLYRTSYSSVLTIVSFSMERYLAICHPLYSHTMSGFKRALRIIGMVWLGSLLAALPYVFFTKLHYIDRPLNSGNLIPESAFCALLEDRPRVSSTINPLDVQALVIVK